MKYTWEYSDNEEIWRHDLFDTVEDCVLDAKENYCVEAGTEIVVGESVPCEIYIDSTDVLETLENQIYDEYGEVAEGWNAFNYKEDKEKLESLSRKLSNVIRIWLQENNNLPTFYKIDNIEVIEVK